jgi:hypothetical protein
MCVAAGPQGKATTVPSALVAPCAARYVEPAPLTHAALSVDPRLTSIRVCCPDHSRLARRRAQAFKGANKRLQVKVAAAEAADAAPAPAPRQRRQRRAAPTVDINALQPGQEFDGSVVSSLRSCRACGPTCTSSRRLTPRFCLAAGVCGGLRCVRRVRRWHQWPGAHLPAVGEDWRSSSSSHGQRLPPPAPPAAAAELPDGHATSRQGSGSSMVACQQNSNSTYGSRPCRDCSGAVATPLAWTRTRPAGAGMSWAVMAVAAADTVLQGTCR